MKKATTERTARLEALAHRLERAYVADGPLPHLQLLVSAEKEILLDRCCGAARADGSPLHADALYRLASMSKPITIAALLTLADEGRVALDTPVAEVLPEFAAPRLWTGEADEQGHLAATPYEGVMTIFDLLRHTAGFSYSIHGATPLDGLYTERSLDSFHQRRTSDEYATALAELPLLYPPGERFHYSVSIDLVGVVIERLSGLPLDRFLEQRIFEPLGMRDSFFMVPADYLCRLTDAWMVESPGAAPVLYDRGAHSRWRMPQKSWSAGGGLVSSARDYHRFLMMLMYEGVSEGERILSRESVALMLANQLPSGGDLAGEGAAAISETSQAGIGMGLGGAVLLDPARAEVPGSPGTYFWGGLLSTGFFLDPLRRVIGIAMTQLMPSTATRMREDFRRGVYKALWENGDG